MKAFIVNLSWNLDRKVSSNVVLFASDRKEAITQAMALYPEHTVFYAEHAPWLDRPESTK